MRTTRQVDESSVLDDEAVDRRIAAGRHLLRAPPALRERLAEMRHPLPPPAPTG